MSVDGNGFKVGIDFDSVLSAISKQIYETPLAFIRENVQNAVDALRMQANREGQESGDASLAVHITASSEECAIADNGIGMSLNDLQNLFWTIGASGKRTAEARAAGCVGMFGIGGFANFGVCDELEVTSQQEADDEGHWTRLSRQEIEAAGGAIPEVKFGASEDASPRGTIVRGRLKTSTNVDDLRTYLRDFVRYAQEQIYFNGELISGDALRIDRPETASAIGGETSWSHGNVQLQGALYEDATNTLSAELSGLVVDGTSVRLVGRLRFESGPLDLLKRGFKLCATTIGTHIGVSGVLDCDVLAPTAGRDSLNPESSALVNDIVACMERVAVSTVLESPARIAQHTRIFRFVRANGLIDQLGNVVVELADGSQLLLSEVARRSETGLRVFFATSQNRSLSQILQARGHLVVQLPADRDKQLAVRDYLTSLCKAEAFEGRIECSEVYESLSRFEKAFLAEMEETIIRGYDVSGVKLVPGSLTEDIPVYVPAAGGSELTIFVDVRHAEISKLERLGITALFTSMVAAFCREYLGQALRGRSPKFFGSGAVNLDWLAKRRSELWVLLTDDIEVLTRQSQRQVVTTSDVEVVQAGPVQGSDQQPLPGREPKLVRIEGTAEFAELFGYYLRIPSSAYVAYGDVIQECDSLGAVWAGNKILFVASDAISSAFQFEIRLDRLITTGEGTSPTTEGASQLARPLQSLFGGLYFPVPTELEQFLVPKEAGEIRIEVRCDWIDFASARAWQAREVEDA